MTQGKKRNNEPRSKIPPESDPVITGGQPRYHIGDTVNVTCSIRSSKPAANLTWLINERKADPKLVHGPFKQYVGREGLESSSIVLQFVVRQKHFVRGNMKLKCAASIATIYVRVNEKSFGGERPQKGLVLESRGTAQAPNGSRADRVHTSAAKLVFSVSLKDSTPFSEKPSQQPHIKISI
ncbi:hypothetical protein HUJ05_002077 [Dendroctonus ponderosae]|nr:hypothetical protein HUJ05_002077 [Dendroctonus ponderosae]